MEVISYLYTYSCHEDEFSLCMLEQRMLFGENSGSNILESTIKIDPSRSPFIKGRIDVFIKADTLEELINSVKRIPPVLSTFKVIVINHGDVADKVGYEDRRKLERKIGLLVPGKANLVMPELVFAVMKAGGKWIFGTYIENENIWLLHQKKPHQYSTALSTRVARAVVNIAVPNPSGIKAIDPCCGIGTVLVEALSMGIDIVGSDNNPLVMKGARENIAHFGFIGEVILRDIRDVTGYYDVAILDLPYNLCSVITPEEILEMLASAKRFASRIVIVTVEEIEGIVRDARLTIVDRCLVSKSRFTRHVLVCE